jgi:hypothetical protein
MQYDTNKPTGHFAVALSAGAFPLSPKEVFFDLLGGTRLIERIGDELVFYSRNSGEEIARMKPTDFEFVES